MMYVCTCVYEDMRKTRKAVHKIIGAGGFKWKDRTSFY